MIIRSGLTGDDFIAAVKTFDANIAISGNFVLTVKNSSTGVLRIRLRKSPLLLITPLNAEAAGKTLKLQN